MRTLLKLIALITFFTSLLGAVKAQNTTNKGTEFWTTYMDHVNGAGTRTGASKMSLYITSDVNTTGQVSIADDSFTPIAFNVTANDVTVVDIPSNAFLGNQSGLALKGIHVTALKPVAVYAHIYAQNVSGATLLLPVSTLGKDYLSINYTQQSNSAATYSVFEVIGTEDNTTVQITPAAFLLGGQAAKSTFTITLNKGEVYQGLSADDLTGTHIKSISANGEACKRIAVFAGSSKILIGSCPVYVTSDNLFQQVYPTASWGKNYISVPLSGRNYDIYRVVVSNPATVITINGTVIDNSLYATTGYYEFPSQSPQVISASQPVQVVQYAVSQNQTINCTPSTTDVGDPEMIYLNPLEQSLSHVTLYSTPNYRITKSFINVVLPADEVAGFQLDGAAYRQFTPIAGSAYSYAQIPVSPGTHNIGASGNFNAIAYGFGDKESYGYAAGTDLKNLYEYINLQDPSEKIVLLSGCSDLVYKLKLTLPYATNKITWDFKNGTAPVVQNNPVAVTSVKNGQTLYTYTYTQTIKYAKGDYSIVATVFNAVADECGQNEDVEFSFSVVDPPPIAFTSANVCLGEATQFTYPDDPNDPNPKTYSWDFGDGTALATEQNPAHTYAAPGAYQVVLSVTNSSGCIAVSAAKTVNISKKPVAGFQESLPDCTGKQVVFTDQSVPSTGTALASWSWDFGDGQTSVLQSPAHTFAATGTYTVKLIITNNKGCTSEVFTKDIAIHPLPVADFTLPDVCLDDPFAKFTDRSSIDDHTESEFTYLWNFGDGNAVAANNTSTLKNPSHKYSAAAVYNVTLTITSKYGCATTKTQLFTINGTTPKAIFAVENKDFLCSGSDVLFDNLSTVDFGNITKVVWYFDITSHPTEGVTFLRSKGEIPADGKFTHNYGLFNAPLKKNYAVKLVVYSGETCVNESPITNIVVNANPVVSLSAPVTICQEAIPVQIAENRNGFEGTAVFTGPGVSSTGLFKPQAAGVGTAVINYLFTANATGCTYASSVSIVVNPKPVVSAGPDIQVLDGEQTVLHAAATGNNLTYKWIPTTGLSNPNILNPVASPTDNTTYTLIATSANGCSASVNVKVFVLKMPEVPNTFTPNNDGINDLWYIKYLDTYPDCTVEVFSRNGEKIYSSIGYGVPWDGRYKGADLPVGVYYYIINPKNGRKTMAGYVTIIK